MAETVLEVLASTARTHPTLPALARKRGGRWQALNWSQFQELVERTARGFVALGVEPGCGVVILSANRPEWPIADLAAMAVGALPAGIYTNTTPEQCRYIAEHASARLAIVDNRAALQRLTAAGGPPTGLRHVVLLDGEAETPTSSERSGLGELTWDELLARGDASAEAESEVARRSAGLRREDVCTLIYTSGTTGTPKGVMLTHGNLVFIADRARELLPIVAGDRLISYLPLSHIAEQVASMLLSLATGACVYFAESIEKMPENLREVRPQLFLGVPRVWEKVQAGIQVAGAQSGPLRRRIVAWARGVGREGGEADQQGRRPPWRYAIADRLVFAKVRARLGLDRARMLVVSAAPIAKETLDFFQSLGLPIMEFFGMSECTGPTTLSLPARYRLGRAGYGIPETELRISEDGEILIRGPHVFKGYYRDPAATAETLDADGFLHSGDVGDLDADGFLRVTDRRKELLITAGGKNIAPQYLEGRLKQIPGVSQAVAIGDRRPYVVALLTLDPARVATEAAKAGSPARTAEAAAACPLFRDHVWRQVEVINASLARFETIKHIALLPAELSVETGELTPTLKLRRRVILERYGELIESLYR